MKSGDNPSNATRAPGAFIDASKQASEHPADPPNDADQSIPDKTIQPARDQGGRLADRDDRVGVELVDPHFVFEEAKERGLRLLKRIGLAGAAINQNP